MTSRILLYAERLFDCDIRYFWDTEHRWFHVYVHGDLMRKDERMRPSHDMDFKRTRSVFHAQLLIKLFHLD